jgi:hypothetical protein
MDKITEVELRLDGYYQALAERGLGCPCCGLTIDRERIILVCSTYYIEVCKACAMKFRRLDWKVYGQDH